MAVTQTPPGMANNNFLATSAATSFASFGDWIQYVNKPEYVEKVKSRFMQDLGISELLSTLGREFEVGRDSELFWFEEGRRYISGSGTIAAVSPSDTGAKVITDSNHKVRDDEEVVINGEIRAHVTATTSTTFTVVPKSTTWGVTFASAAAVNYFVFGNEFQKSSNQPTEWITPNVQRYEASTMIIKDIFKMSGSQATDKTWIPQPNGTGAYIYYGEAEGFKRFRSMEEMEMILGQKAENTNLSAYNGTEGLFDALETRGTVWSGYIESLSDIDDITEALDTEAGEAAYGAYVNSKQFNYLRNLVADNVGLAAYGMFNNGQEDAIKFGFKGLVSSGYEIMFHKWSLLNNPQLLGKDQVFKGVLFPMGEIRDPESGQSIPCLSVLYKGLGGYSRKFESWLTGAMNGTYTDSNGNDSLTVNYRSEKGMRVAAANRFVLIK